MAINFPNSPTLNQQFTSGGTTWIWDGTKWNLYLGSDIVTTAYLSSTLSGYARNIPYSASATAGASIGDYYVNSTENIIYVYTGVSTGWVSLGSAPDSDQAIIAQRMFS